MLRALKNKQIIWPIILTIIIFLAFSGLARSYTSSVPVSLTVPPASLEVSGYASPGSLITIYDASVPVGTVVSNASGNFIKNISTIASGLHTISVSQKDVLGVESSVVSRLINIPPQQTTQLEFVIPPTIGLSPSKTTVGGIITISGYAYPGSEVSLFLDNSVNAQQKVIAGSNGFYIFKINTSGYTSGKHIVYTKNKASFGESNSSKLLSFIVDSNITEPSKPTTPQINTGSQPQAPNTPVITTPPSEYQISGDKVTISGNAEPNANVVIEVNGVVVGSVFADATGRWAFDFYPTDAENSVVTYSCDNGGCSAKSDEIILYYQVKGALSCRDNFKLKEYRFNINQNSKINLTIEYGEQKPRNILLDWGDGTIEKFSVNADETIGNYDHIYKDYGQFNGRITSYLQNNDCASEKFFSVKVNQVKPINMQDLLVLIILALLGIILVILLAIRLNRGIKNLKV